MKYARIQALIAPFLVLFCSLCSAVEAFDFASDAERDRFYALLEETRCMVCQNQSLADSDAPLARDLRNEIMQQMRAGNSDAQIREFLVERYSEFVLYRPALSPANLLLWLGPLLFVVIGSAIVIRVIRNQPNEKESAKTDPSAGDSA